MEQNTTAEMKSRKKLCFIYNPRAGKGSLRAHIADAIERFAQEYEVQVLPTAKSGDAISFAKELAGSVDLLVCGGGDGTLSEVVNGVTASGKEQTIGYIPAGSTNDYAYSLGLTTKVREAADIIVSGREKKVDLGMFGEKVFTYVAAFGLFTDVSYQTSQKLKNVLGHTAYMLSGIKSVFHIPSYHLRVTMDGDVVEGDYMLCMICNTRSVGGFKKFKKLDIHMDDGLFEVILVPAFRGETHMDAKESEKWLLKAVRVFRASHIMVEADREIPWTLDGEAGGEYQNADISVRKQAATIVLPQEK